MKVYKLIQELAQYKADCDVNFHLKGVFNTDIDLDDEHSGNYDVEIDEYVEIEDTSQSSFSSLSDVNINLKY